MKTAAEIHHLHLRAEVAGDALAALGVDTTPAARAHALAAAAMVASASRLPQIVRALERETNRAERTAREAMGLL